MMRFALPILFGLLAAPGAAAGPGPRAPVPIPSTWRVEYPRLSVLNEQEGRVTYVLTIDEKGRVTSCVVTASSGYSRLDKAACRTAKGARFEPALDASGSPTTGRYEDTAVYELN